MWRPWFATVAFLVVGTACAAYVIDRQPSTATAMIIGIVASYTLGLAAAKCVHWPWPLY